VRRIGNGSGGCGNMVSTKIEFSHNSISRITDLDDLARLLFPGNKTHQRVFLAVFLGLKYAPRGFLGSLDGLYAEHGFSKRVLETVRAKMRRLGLIDHVSRFNKASGYREGWVFSKRFGKSTTRLTELAEKFKEDKGLLQEKKDRDLFRYI